MKRRLLVALVALPLCALTSAEDCGSGVSGLLNKPNGGGGGGGGLDCSDNQNVVTCPLFTCPGTTTTPANCGACYCSKADAPCNGTPVHYVCMTNTNNQPYCCPSAGAPCNHSYDCCPGLACNAHVCSTMLCPAGGDDPCGAAGSWTFTCAPKNCGVCGPTGGSVSITIPADVAAKGGTFDVQGYPFTFDLASCSVDLGASACGISAGVIHFSPSGGAYLSGTYKCATDCATCGPSMCPGTKG